MLKKLRARWKVNGLNLVLIIATFALGGSLCGYAGRKILLLTGLEKGAAWVILYILLITLLWPVCVLLISVPLGQFSFFSKYIARVGKRMIGHSDKKKIVRVAIFASGAGSNAEKIIMTSSQPPVSLRQQAEEEIPKNKSNIFWEVALIVCNKPGAGVLNIAANHKIPTLLVEKDRFFNGDNYLPELQKQEIDFIVLAGFLWKIPIPVIQAYPKKIINIHPALLPKYGGKGMYGPKVHEAVIAAGEKESGITIHYVDELYDHGEIILQARCAVNGTDNAESLAQKIHALEHIHYPKMVAELIEKQNRS